MLDGARFAETVAVNPTVHQEVSAYATQFIMWFNEQKVDTLSDLMTRDMLPDDMPTSSTTMLGLVRRSTTRK